MLRLKSLGGAIAKAVPSPGAEAFICRPRQRVRLEKKMGPRLHQLKPHQALRNLKREVL